MRYTECRLQHFSSATFLADLDADTVDFTPNFDASQVSLHICVGVHQSDNSIIVLLLENDSCACMAQLCLCDCSKWKHADVSLSMPTFCKHAYAYML